MSQPKSMRKSLLQIVSRSSAATVTDILLHANSDKDSRAASRVRDNEQLEAALTQIAGGDRAAFKVIYALTASKFTAIINQMVKDEELAADILQKGYLSIWRNAARYDATKAKPFTWMLVIMRNRAIDVLRSRARLQTSEELSTTLVDPLPRPEQSAQMDQLRGVLAKHLDALPPSTATAIWLNIVDGWTCNEIGAHLKVPPNTVKSWIRRGLEKLQHSLPFNSLQYAI